MTNQEAKEIMQEVGRELTSIHKDIKIEWTVTGVERADKAFDRIANVIDQALDDKITKSDPDQHAILMLSGVSSIPTLPQDWRKSDVEKLFAGIARFQTYYDYLCTKEHRIAEYASAMNRVAELAREYETSSHSDNERPQLDSLLKTIKSFTDTIITDESDGAIIAGAYLVKIREMVNGYEYQGAPQLWDHEKFQRWSNTAYEIADLGKQYVKERDQRNLLMRGRGI